MYLSKICSRSWLTGMKAKKSHNLLSVSWGISKVGDVIHSGWCLRGRKKWMSQFKQREQIHPSFAFSGPQEIGGCPPILVKVNFFFFNWSVVDLQCCVNFCCTAKWFNYIGTFFFIFFSIMVYHRILNISLCYTGGPCCLSILYLTVCLC